MGVRDNDDVWVVIPVYNEAPMIASVIADVAATFPNVVCVDDGCTDGSATEIASSPAHLVRHPVNLGQGAALQTGLSYAMARPQARYFATFDADGQHQVDDVAGMVAILREGDADVVLGSRFLEGRGEMPVLKRLVLRLAVALSPTTRRLRLTDAHNGLRVFVRPVAERLRIRLNGMAHASEIVSTLAGSPWRIREVPVTIRYTDYSRNKGQSMINGVNILFDLAVRQKG